jgi:hypothetical protein
MLQAKLQALNTNYHIAILGIKLIKPLLTKRLRLPKRAVVPTYSTQGTCHSTPFSTTYIRTCNVDITTLTDISSNTTFQSRLF